MPPSHWRRVARTQIDICVERLSTIDILVLLDTIGRRSERRSRRASSPGLDKHVDSGAADRHLCAFAPRRARVRSRAQGPVLPIVPAIRGRLPHVAFPLLLRAAGPIDDISTRKEGT